MSGEYDPTRCDLCGAAEFDTLPTPAAVRSLRSDGVILPRRLWKVRCRGCGLVRDGHPVGELNAVYAADYTPAPADYTFHTPAGPLRRSAAFADWLGEAFAVPDGGRVLEVGAGAGALLAELQERFPRARLEGVELSERAAAEARSRGRAVRAGGTAGYSPSAFDAVYSIAVLEHVPSPTAFLFELHRLLVPGGTLLLAQPTQDVPSTDVLFADHLHHFATAHVERLGAKAGFAQVRQWVGHRWMPNFSLHLFCKTEPSDPPVVVDETTCGESLRELTAAMRRLDDLLTRLAGRRVAVFGLGEVYSIARAYSALDSFPLACGLLDGPPPPVPFPVVPPERAGEFGVTDVLLAVNAVHVPHAAARLAQLNVTTHPILTGEADPCS